MTIKERLEANRHVNNSSYKLARNYHVAPSTIQRIINGKTWKQICLAAGEKGGEK